MVIFVSCATAPTQQELANADYGKYPTNYEDIIRNHMFGLLKDPYSAQYQYAGSPAKGWAYFLMQSDFGYGVCVRINAKNSFGGYMGYNRNFFLIRNDRVIQHYYENVAEKYNVMQGLLDKYCGR